VRSRAVDEIALTRSVTKPSIGLSTHPPAIANVLQRMNSVEMSGSDEQDPEQQTR
jgi:hypothetical protein